MFIQLLIAFNLGLFSTLHCLGMCGGILSAMMIFNKDDNSDNHSRKLTFSLAYNVGRIISYSLAGLIAAFLSQEIIIRVSSVNAHLILQSISALVLTGLALNILGVLPFNNYIEQAGGRLWRYLQPLGRRLLPINSPSRAVKFGMLWGWLPCGMVYAALILAMSAASPYQGMLVMLSFGLGTLPGMVSAGYFSSALIELKSNKSFRIMTALMLILIAASLPISAYYFSDHSSLHQEHSHHHLH